MHERSVGVADQYCASCMKDPWAAKPFPRMQGGVMHQHDRPLGCSSGEEEEQSRIHKQIPIRYLRKIAFFFQNQSTTIRSVMISPFVLPLLMRTWWHRLLKISPVCILPADANFSTFCITERWLL
jgi:hypothetical protein